MLKKDIPRGVVLYRGMSPFAAGKSFVVIAIFNSDNKKTGDMIQTYIILDSMKATDSLKTGDDKAVCGSCPLRGKFGKDRACYVNLGQGPRSVLDGYQRGIYPDYDSASHDDLFRGRVLRFGTYGEPVLIPLDIVKHLAYLVEDWTGYTHQFLRKEFQAYRHYFMASTHSARDRERATERGWRYFNTTNADAPDYKPLEGVIVCPASAEAGRVMHCEECRLCNGTFDNDSRKNIQIAVHGGFGQIAASKRLAVLNQL